jgi:hypothetical protein
MDTFERYARAAMEFEGLNIEESDVHIMRAANAAYGPDLKALEALDVRHIWSEPDLDPSRPPRGPAGPE